MTNTADMTLADYITKNRLAHREVMNHLQDHGVISSNAIEPSDVPPCDALAAISFLEFSPVHATAKTADNIQR